MDKPAATDHPIHDLLRNRWSPRAFDPRPVEKDKLLSILEAARWAASSNNEQPWHYLLATQEDAAAFSTMLSCLVPANQVWARHAPVLMISVAKTFFARNNTPNRCADHDVGAASAQLTAQATALGLFVHQMAGIEPSRIRATYKLPDRYDPIAALAIGYPGSPDALEEKLRARELSPRNRNPLSSFVFSGTFGSPSSLTT